MPARHKACTRNTKAHSPLAREVHTLHAVVGAHILPAEEGHNHPGKEEHSLLAEEEQRRHFEGAVHTHPKEGE